MQFSPESCGGLVYSTLRLIDFWILKEKDMGFSEEKWQQKKKKTSLMLNLKKQVERPSPFNSYNSISNTDTHLGVWKDKIIFNQCTAE